MLYYPQLVQPKENIKFIASRSYESVRTVTGELVREK